MEPTYTLSDFVHLMTQINGSKDQETTQQKGQSYVQTVADEVRLAQVLGTVEDEAEEIIGNLLFAAAALAIGYDLDIQKVLDDRYEFIRGLAVSEGIKVA